jgi:hypothetical protein
MYRVELKDKRATYLQRRIIEFLMYRVELKERQHTIREQRLPVFGKERRNFWCKYFLRGKYHAGA